VRQVGDQPRLIAMLQISRHLFQKTLILIFHFICVCMRWSYMFEKIFVIRTMGLENESFSK